MDGVGSVHRTLMTLILRSTLEVLAVECWCPELRHAAESECFFYISLQIVTILHLVPFDILCAVVVTSFAIISGLASEYEHKVSFGSLAFLSSPDASAETLLAPLLTKYFMDLQAEWKDLVSKCELERMLRTVLDADLRHFFKNAVFHSVGHILDGTTYFCYSYQRSINQFTF